MRVNDHAAPALPAPPDMAAWEDFVSGVRAILPDGLAVGNNAGDLIGAAPGAYALLVRLTTSMPFARGVVAGTCPPGWHVYAGSARGRGGIAARLRHHFRVGKPVHWHIDELTNTAERIAALAIPGGSECDIVDRLLRSGFRPSLRRFGSSDCRRCPAHLLTPVE